MEGRELTFSVWCFAPLPHRSPFSSKLCYFQAQSPPQHCFFTLSISTRTHRGIPVFDSSLQAKMRDSNLWFRSNSALGFGQKMKRNAMDYISLNLYCVEIHLNYSCRMGNIFISSNKGRLQIFWPQNEKGTTVLRAIVSEVCAELSLFYSVYSAFPAIQVVLGKATSG